MQNFRSADIPFSCSFAVENNGINIASHAHCEWCGPLIHEQCLAIIFASSGHSWSIAGITGRACRSSSKLRRRRGTRGTEYCSVEYRHAGAYLVREAVEAIGCHFRTLPHRVPRLLLQPNRQKPSEGLVSHATPESRHPPARQIFSLHRSEHRFPGPFAYCP